jgi:hypothetical protein
VICELTHDDAIGLRAAKLRRARWATSRAARRAGRHRGSGRPATGGQWPLQRAMRNILPIGPGATRRILPLRRLEYPVKTLAQYRLAIHPAIRNSLRIGRAAARSTPAVGGRNRIGPSTAMNARARYMKSLQLRQQPTRPQDSVFNRNAGRPLGPGDWRRQNQSP